MIFISGNYGYADGFWTIEINEEDFVLVSIEDSDYRGIWMLEFGYPVSVLNGSSKVSWKDTMLSERFQIRTSNEISKVGPFFGQRMKLQVDKMRSMDLSSLESGIGVSVRGILGRDAFKDLRVQFSEREGKSFLELTEHEDDSHFERELMGDPIELNFDNGGMMTGIFNVGSNILTLKIMMTGAMDFDLPLDVINLLGSGRKSRQPFSLMTEFSTKNTTSPQAIPEQGWYFNHIFFEGSDLADVRVIEDSTAAIHLGTLLRRSAYFIMDDHPALYLSKTENDDRPPKCFSEIQVRRLNGEYYVTSVRKDGRFNEVLNIGDNIIFLDGKPVANLTASEIRRECKECLERGASIDIRRENVIKHITAKIPKQTHEQMVERLFELSSDQHR